MRSEGRGVREDEAVVDCSITLFPVGRKEVGSRIFDWSYADGHESRLFLPPIE